MVFLGPIRKSKFFLIAVLLVFISIQAYANTRQGYGNWDRFSAIGGFKNNEEFKYYFDSSVRFLFNQRFLNQNVEYLGLGHTLTENTIFYTGVSYFVFHNPNTNKYNSEYRLWQDMHWIAYRTPRYRIFSRTRMEERFRAGEPDTAWRVRQMVQFTFLNAIKNKVNVVLSDEIFINLNSTPWIITHTFEQNRAFLGLGIPVSKKMNLTVGYLNQFINFRNTKVVNHILYLSFDL